MIDLHTHSTASDGSYSPQNLVAHAAIAGITRLSLTDHDTIDGLEDGRAACREAGITLVNGIELSACWRNRTIHIVGLDFDLQNTGLISAVQNAQHIRVERGRTIGERLERSGVTGAYESTCKLAGSILIGRAHFARFLVEQEYAKDFKQVFKRYMTRGKPGYVAADWMSLEDAVIAIHQASGIAVIAHPARYGFTSSKLRRLGEEFSGLSGDAIEVVSGNSSATEVENMTTLANEFGLAASIGSDFHGLDKPWSQLGRLRPLPASCQPVWHLRKLW
jgi:predicted metal-dependent phosphoesterase TrpH